MMSNMSLLPHFVLPQSASFCNQALATSLGLGLVFCGIPPVQARAQMHATVNDSSTTIAAEPMDEVWELIRTADAHADAAEFDAAIDAYTKALKQLSGDPEWASQYNRVRHMLGKAHRGAFRISKNALHLRKAREFLSGYLDTLDVDSHDRPDTEKELREIEQELKSLEEEAAESPDVDEDAKSPSATEPDSLPPPPPPPESIDRESLPMSDRSKAMIISGAIVGGLGLVSAGLAGVAFAESRRQHTRGKNGQADFWPQDELDKVAKQRDRMATLSLIGAISSGAMILTGALLVGLARSSHKKTSMAGIFPVYDAHMVGLGWSGRF